MNRRLLCGLVAVCLLLTGCRRPTVTQTTAVDVAPARTLLVIPTDHTGAQCFLLIRLSGTGDVAVTAYPQETVLLSKFQDFPTFYALYADGGATATYQTLRTLDENGFLIDRILSVDVETSDSGFYALLSSLGNNLLFTNPPSVVYTVGNERNGSSGTALSAVHLRQLLCRPSEEFTRPEDYAQLRALTAAAILRECKTAFADDPDALFFALTRAGPSSFSPADRTVCFALFSPAASVRCPKPHGTFVGEDARMRFYLRAL